MNQNWKSSWKWTRAALILASLLASVFMAGAQPAVTMVVPENGTFGVSPTAPVVFTFSEPMDTEVTAAEFTVFIPPVTFETLPTTPAWSAGNTVLTCTPVQPFPSSTPVIWTVDGANPNGDWLEGDNLGGGFITGSGGSTECTNTGGSLTVAKGSYSTQDSASGPALDADIPYIFLVCGTVACSNATTTNITVTVPGGATITAPETPIPDHYSKTTVVPDLGTLNANYPSGNYVFNLKSPSGMLPFTVNYSPTLTVPAPPFLSNYESAQSIDATKDFILRWNPFTNGTASDAIWVEINGDVFQTPTVGTAGMLDGTARSVTIPANTLAANSNYSGSITFYDLNLGIDPVSGYMTLAYAAATTEFSLRTIGPVLDTPIVLTNGVKSASAFTFEITSSPGQSLLIQYRTNLALGQWLTLLATNSPSPDGRVRISDPQAAGRSALFYRAIKP